MARHAQPARHAQLGPSTVPVGVKSPNGVK